MHALLALTLANIRSYTRDRAAAVLDAGLPARLHRPVRAHLPGQRQRPPDARLGRRGRLGGTRPSCAPASPRSTASRWSTRRVRAAQRGRCRSARSIRSSSSRPATARRSRHARRAAARRPRSRSTPTRRGRSSRARSTRSSARVLGVVNLGGRPPLVVPSPQTVQTENLNAISYFVPSMLGLSIMQVGIFAAIPLVGRPREAHPQAPGRDAAAALAAGRLERADAGAHRAHPGGHHRGRRRRCSSASRSSAA